MSSSAGRVLLIPKGEYNSATQYSLLDVVTYEHDSYVAKQTTQGNAPTNTTYWQKLTDVGEDVDELKEALTDEAETRSAMGAKNLIPYPFQDTRTSIQGITYIDNGDGTLTVDGTALATSYFNLTDKDFGEISFSSLSPSSSSKYVATLVGGSNTVLLTYNKGNKLTSIQINKDTVVSNLVLKPMLRLATDSDPTFQPYAMTNKELTDALGMEIVASSTTPSVTYRNRLNELAAAYKYA